MIVLAHTMTDQMFASLQVTALFLEKVVKSILTKATRIT